MVYLIILAVLFYGFVKYDLFCNTNYKKSYFVFSSILLFLLSALRYRIGIDTPSYMYEYNISPTLLSLDYDDIFYSIERMPLWNIIIATCKQISSNYVIYQIFHSSLVNIAVCGFIYRYANRKHLALLLYYLMIYTTLNFDAMREGIAVSLFLISINYLHKNKYFKYYFLIALAILTHIGAIILLFFPLLTKIKYTKSKDLLILSVIIFIFLSYGFFNNYLKGLNILLSYGDLGGKVFRCIVSSNEGAINIVSLVKIFIYNIVFVVFVFISSSFNVEDKSIFKTGYILFALFGVMSFSINICYRFQNYFYIFYIVALSNIFYNKKPFELISTNKIIKVAAVLFIVLYLNISRYFNISPLDEITPVYKSYIPYSSVITNSTDSQREKLHYLHLRGY